MKNLRILAVNYGEKIQELIDRKPLIPNKKNQRGKPKDHILRPLVNNVLNSVENRRENSMI